MFWVFVLLPAVTALASFGSKENYIIIICWRADEFFNRIYFSLCACHLFSAANLDNWTCTNCKCVGVISFLFSTKLNFYSNAFMLSLSGLRALLKREWNTSNNDRDHGLIVTPQQNDHVFSIPVWCLFVG